MAATLKFGGDVKGLLRSLKQAEAGVSGFSSAARKSILAVSATMAALTTQGFRMAADLDLQMRRVQNLTGFSAETRKELTDSVEELSKAHGINATELALAAEAAHTQGIEVGRLNQVLETGANVTNAYGGSVENNTRQLVKMAQVWGLNTKQVVAFGQAGAKVGDTNLAKLLTQLANVSTQTSRLNLDFKETSLVLGFATRHMKSTDRAGAALVQVFAELAKLDSKVSVAIQERYGKSFANMVLEAGNAFDVLQRMLDDFGQEPLTQLFGSVEAQSALPSIFLQLDEMRQVASQSEADLIRGVEAEFENIAESAAVNTNRLRETWNDFVRDLTSADPGSPMYNTIISLIDLLESDDFRSAFEGVADGMEALIKQIPSLVEALGGIAGMLGNIVGFIGPIVDFLGEGAPTAPASDAGYLERLASEGYNFGGPVGLEASPGDPSGWDYVRDGVLTALNFLGIGSGPGGSSPGTNAVLLFMAQQEKWAEIWNEQLETEKRMADQLEFQTGYLSAIKDGINTLPSGFDRQVSESLGAALTKGNIAIDTQAINLAGVARSQGRDATSRGQAMFLQDLFAELRDIAAGDYATFSSQDEVNRRLDAIAELLGLGNDLTEEVAENTEQLQDRNYLVISSLSADYDRRLSP